jgi:D-serine deaminase-like pyridoxal phosphate-dependent protein
MESNVKKRAHPLIADWSVIRLSQEHSILGLSDDRDKAKTRADDVFKVGQKVALYCQHACITAAAFYVYYVVDDDDVVRDTGFRGKVGSTNRPSICMLSSG